jgi:hypothetical protein
MGDSSRVTVWPRGEPRKSSLLNSLVFDSYDVKKVALMQPNSPQRNNTNRGKMMSEAGECCIVLGICVIF